MGIKHVHACVTLSTKSWRDHNTAMEQIRWWWGRRRCTSLSRRCGRVAVTETVHGGWARLVRCVRAWCGAGRAVWVLWWLWGHATWGAVQGGWARVWYYDAKRDMMWHVARMGWTSRDTGAWRHSERSRARLVEAELRCAGGFSPLTSIDYFSSQ